MEEGPSKIRAFCRDIASRSGNAPFFSFKKASGGGAFLLIVAGGSDFSLKRGLFLCHPYREEKSLP
jgi:hypothetical protein